MNAELVDKKCYVETNDGECFEGLVQAASEMGVLVKPKGSPTPRLINAADLKSIEKIPDALRKLKAKRVDILTPDKARRHLLEWHAWFLSTVNDLTEEEAMREHEMLEHENLGHYHGEPRKKEDADTETEGDE